MQASKLPVEEISSVEALRALRHAMDEHQRAVEVLDCALARVRVTEETLREMVKTLGSTHRPSAAV